MCQIFSSQCVEIVEGVVQLLCDVGIDVCIINGCLYYSKCGSQFSYLDISKVFIYLILWVVYVDDQLCVCEILCDVCLLEIIWCDYFIVEFVFCDQVGEVVLCCNWVWCICIGLLLVIVVVVMVVMMCYCGVFMVEFVQVWQVLLQVLVI